MPADTVIRVTAPSRTLYSINAITYMKKKGRASCNSIQIAAFYLNDGNKDEEYILFLTAS